MTRLLQSIAFVATLALAAAASAATPTAGDPTTAAFAAAYGQAAPVTREVVRPGHPPGCLCGGAPMQVTLSVAPQQLVELGGGRYALVAYETDTAPAHTSPGAIGVAYLRRMPAGWRLERRWDELAWTGDSGNPADRTELLTRGAAPPLLFAIEQQTHQGLMTTMAWALELGPSAPSLVGAFPFGGELNADNGCDFDKCGAWEYQGAIRPARSSASLFTVTYTGWREWPGKAHKAHFKASAGYHVVAGKLLPDLWVPLPDCGDGACVNGPGYPPV